MKTFTGKIPKIDHTATGEKRRYTSTKKFKGFERKQIERPQATYDNLQVNELVDKILNA